MNKLPSVLSLIFLLNIVFSTSAVQAQERKGWSPQAKGAVIGAGSGAILGAVINKRNRAVGGVVGGVVGGGVGYGVGKHVDNKNKERARIAAANRAAAAREAEYRAASRRSAARSNRREAVAATRAQNPMTPANSLVASGTGAIYPAQANAAAYESNAAYLPNDSQGDASKPYSTSEYRRKSW